MGLPQLLEMAMLQVQVKGLARQEMGWAPQVMGLGL
jgi:hypothetical protein